MRAASRWPAEQGFCDGRPVSVGFGCAAVSAGVLGECGYQLSGLDVVVEPAGQPAEHGIIGRFGVDLLARFGWRL
jgi:hypothetical protein